MTIVCLPAASGSTPGPSVQPPLVLNEKEAAVQLGVSARTLQAMRVDGSGPPFVRLSDRRIGYAVAALQSWIASRSVRSTSEATMRRIGGEQ